MTGHTDADIVSINRAKDSDTWEVHIHGGAGQVKAFGICATPAP